MCDRNAVLRRANCLCDAQHRNEDLDWTIQFAMKRMSLFRIDVGTS